MPPKKKKTKAKKKQQGVGAHCKILLQYLHPAMIIEEVMPKNGRRDKQHLADCIVVSRETRKIKKLPKVCIVVKHPSFGDRLIYCAERYAKVTAEGDRDGWFDTEAATQLPGVFPLTFKQAFEQDKKRQPIDLSFLDLDKEGGHQTRTEDIALARSQGIDVDDDNEPAPENIPPAGADINYQDNLYGQTWGWNGTCNRKSNHHSHEGAKIEGMSRADLKQTTKLDMFLIFFPINYLEDVVVVETSKVLVGMTYQPMTMGELVRFFGCIFFMSCFSGMDRNDWFSSSPITMGKGAPYRLSRYMPGYRYNQIMNCLCLTTKDPNILDRFWEVRDLIAAWNKNMQEVYIPSWVSCLDESMSIWHMRWTCPGYVFCPRKPHPVGNEYHTIADGTSTILYAAEIVMGKDTPDDYVHQYEAEEGKTSALLARLTRSIWHTGKLVILDSGFCVLKALINLKKKRGLYAGAVIKKRRYWPSYIQGMCCCNCYCIYYI